MTFAGLSAWLMVLASVSACADMPSARLGRLTPAQVSNVTGTYTTVHRGKPYTVTVQQAADRRGDTGLMVTGFFDERRAESLAGVNRALAHDAATVTQGICDTLRTVVCKSEGMRHRSGGFCASRKALHLAAKRYLRAPGTPGMVFWLSDRGTPFGGDSFEDLKGNLLLPEKEYRVVGVALNDHNELSRMVFRETGYLQFFTSETLTFTKDSEDVSEHVARYVDAANSIHDRIDRDHEFVCAL